MDPQTQQIISTRKRQLSKVGQNHKPGPVPITRTKRNFYGATYLFDRIGEDTGVTEDLKTCFPVTWDYVQDRPYKGDTIQADRRMYLHLYYSPERAIEDEMAFNFQEKAAKGKFLSFLTACIAYLSHYIFIFSGGLYWPGSRWRLSLLLARLSKRPLPGMVDDRDTRRNHGGAMPLLPQYPRRRTGRVARVLLRQQRLRSLIRTRPDLQECHRIDANAHVVSLVRFTEHFEARRRSVSFGH